jgi:hypothetical protein
MAETADEFCEDCGYDLRCFEMPIAIGALVWAALVMFMVIAPAPSVAPVWVIAGLVLSGGMYLAYLWFVKPEVLEQEPGEDPFKVDQEV